MGTLLRRCVKVRTAIELSFGMVSGVGPGIHVLDGGPRASRGRVCFWRGFRPNSNFRVNAIQWSTVMIDDRLVCEKLTIFPYAECRVEFYEWVAFVWYSQLQDRIGGWTEIHLQKRRLTKQQTVPLAAASWRPPCFSHRPSISSGARAAHGRSRCS